MVSVNTKIHNIILDIRNDVSIQIQHSYSMLSRSHVIHWKLYLLSEVNNVELLGLNMSQLGRFIKTKFNK